MKDFSMRYRRNRKQETREALLRSSSAIAKMSGFETSGVDRLMGAIGMADGTFYSHFESKDALFAALVEREMMNSWEMLAVRADPQGADFGQRVRAYLSSKHALHPEDGCALTSLGSEIARADPAIRTLTERWLRKLHRDWSASLAGDGERSWELLAGCVGAVTLARLVNSNALRLEILTSSLRSVEHAFEIAKSAHEGTDRALPVGI